MSSPTIEEVVYNRLITFAALAALISTRAYPLVIPVQATLPAVAYQVIDSNPRHTMTGPSGLTQTRVQITSVANDYAAAKAVDRQVRAAFDAVSFTALLSTTSAGVDVQGAFVDNTNDDYDPDTFAPAAAPVVRTDVILWHTAT